MKRLTLLAFAAATLFSATAVQAQTKVKTKSKSDAAGVSVKSKTNTGAVVLDGPVKRVETLSGIDVFPDPTTGTIMLSFTQQFTQPGTLVMTNSLNKPIYTTALDPQNNTGQPVDLGRISPGVYMVEAKTGNYVYWKKVRIKYPAAPVRRRR
ncbi:T9SS type A sorting domain-containing protein [Hymenobacter sp. BT175]|uniref:T9SS type A sorting domain-containing protein n=1 Tax=Hymenobacter translucens TaxID=2886507 RepID=UPI001D0EA2A0|nr:T9SS type A sorting domain-containing protein [Hymenobacter translucens]MCC2547543.1 T9SS type A sorting domain-containing protein [Hymenobacter translucens]